jgi:hypothetical protein
LAFDGMLSALYEYRIILSGLPFLLAAALILLSAALTISAQVFKAARANPVETLRYE